MPTTASPNSPTSTSTFWRITGTLLVIVLIGLVGVNVANYFTPVSWVPNALLVTGSNTEPLTEATTPKDIKSRTQDKSKAAEYLKPYVGKWYMYEKHAFTLNDDSSGLHVWRGRCMSALATDDRDTTPCRVETPLKLEASPNGSLLATFLTPVIIFPGNPDLKAHAEATQDDEQGKQFLIERTERANVLRIGEYDGYNWNRGHYLCDNDRDIFSETC